MDYTLLMKDIKSAVNATNYDAKVILYGSYARGNNNENSDIDLLILVNNENISRKDINSITYPLYDIEFETGKIISPLVLTQNDWNTKHCITPFYENVQREGIVL